MRILDDYSLEMTAKNVPDLEAARELIPAGTRINVTYLGNEDLPMRLTASKAVKDFGFRPVPHISARRLESQEQLEEFLGALRDNGTVESVFAVGGDPETPMGPYDNSAELIESGVLPSFGVQDVSIAGHPEGHPDVSNEILWEALDAKYKTLKEQKLPGTILTQFSFDVDAVLTWIEAVRARGIDLPIRVGLPGPAGIKRLLGFARRFGVASSAGIAKKYGFSITNLLGTAGPDNLIKDLESRYDPAIHGVVKVHFYTFNGMTATSEWIRDFQAQQHS
ncbi:MAG TPA: methylenetetrahydrofolate reductase [Pseudolysinimonas sp.]|nr:methylenetetrahydrofolate reductase [Pseudolysinimonas sp.]